MSKTKEKEIISPFKRITRKENALEIAKKLKSNGVSIEIIISSTGLTKKEIENL